MNGQHTNTAHGVLGYLISRAVLEGKIGDSTLSIPMTDFITEFEGIKFTEDITDLVLKIKIITSWDSADGEALEINVEDDDEIEEPNGNQ